MEEEEQRKTHDSTTVLDRVVLTEGPTLCVPEQEPTVASSWHRAVRQTPLLHWIEEHAIRPTGIQYVPNQFIQWLL